jgi:hypothetical protein
MTQRESSMCYRWRDAPVGPDLTVVDLKEAVPWMIATAEPPR